MKIHRYLPILTMAVICLTALVLSGCTSDAAPQEPEESGQVVDDDNTSNSSPPPLVVDTSEPLLLDEPTQEQKAAAKASCVNAPCFVCHVNYKDESIAVTHVKQGISCMDCHGDSFAHRNDENNTTPPDKMFPRDEIEPYCRKCHPSHDASAREMAARLHKKSPDVKDVDSAVCTDCHGKHRMNVRTVQWDKTSGELLRTNEG